MNHTLTILIAVLFIATMAAILPWMLKACAPDKTPAQAPLRKKGPKVKEEVKLANGKSLRILMF
jgi:hypothetical protein